MSEKIKRVKTIRFDQKLESVNDKELSIVEYPLSIKEYDKNQNLILESTWASNAMLSEKFTYEYEGNQLKKQCTFSGENEIAETETYKYDNEGKLIESILQYIDGSRDITTYVYNTEGQKISSKAIDEDGDVSQQEFWEYKDAKLISYQLVNEYGETEIEQKMTYNIEGKTIRKDYFNSLEENEYYIIFEYDEKGALVLESKYGPTGKLREEKSYQYNSEGRIILEKTENAKETLVKEYKYDSAGNQIYSIEREEDDEITNFEVWRNYDDTGKQSSSKVIIYGNGMGNDVQYEVKYEYEYY